MYTWLRRILPARAANSIAVLWYTLLLLLIYGLWQAPRAAFRYILI
ncbi:MAG: hypothetical protein JRG80_03690 [Deltaproteobacteria bacterium]|nr:hypothetical protein [Deltaproteobacteria bacterium]MBW2398356.1 hypothetical protein [Deltaproteobacteria bacterium]MBW2666893.1 hypothetical protein [Deltaproteobacteria bacterium]